MEKPRRTVAETELYLRSAERDAVVDHLAARAIPGSAA